MPTASEIEMEKIRKRMAAKGKARGVKPRSAEQQAFDKEMMDKTIRRTAPENLLKKPRKSKQAF